LIDDIEANATGEFVDIWMENAVHKTDGRRFVRILVWDFDVDLPLTTGEWCWLKLVSEVLLR